jgi:cytochrome c oxidase subunit 4
MADSHEAGQHAEPSRNVYLAVFAVLCVCTAVSFLVNMAEPVLGVKTGAMIILIVAVLKATLVTMYFMHVKFDWKRVYFLIIPVAILAGMMMVVLMPDTVVAWHND